MAICLKVKMVKQFKNYVV